MRSGGGAGAGRAGVGPTGDLPALLLAGVAFLIFWEYFLVDQTLYAGDTAFIFLPMRAYNAAGFNIGFRGVKTMTKPVPVSGELMPLMISFADEDKPQTARRVAPDRLDQALGPGYRFKSLTLMAVPVGLWPLDIGSRLGEPVSRYIEREIAWLVKAGDPSAQALAAANIKVGEAMNAESAFRR